MSTPPPSPSSPPPPIRIHIPHVSRATGVLLALNIGVWLLQVLTGVSPLHPSSPALVAWGGNLPLFTLTGDTWRLFTAMFLHDGIGHLALNMLALISTADRTEDEYGTAPMLVVYLVGGLMASCASVFWREVHALRDPTLLLTVSIGASGAVMAQFGALLAALVMVPPRFARMHPSERPGVDNGLVQVVVLNLALGLLFPGVDQAAHVGGLIGGMAVGALMCIRPAVATPRAALARYGATALLVTACVGALLHTAPRERLLLLRIEWAAQQAAPHH